MVDIGRRDDRMLEKISELVHKRDDTLRQIELWRETDPDISEILNDLELHLR
jgi:hypothetical protein